VHINSVLDVHIVVTEHEDERSYLRARRIHNIPSGSNDFSDSLLEFIDSHLLGLPGWNFFAEAKHGRDNDRVGSHYVVHPL
jgi:hypothetical protein